MRKKLLAERVLMPIPFKLLKKEFSKVYQEWQWTYELKITFNKHSITKLTVTDHYQLEHKNVITNKLIWNLFHTKLNTEILKPTILTAKYLSEKEFIKMEAIELFFGLRKEVIIICE